MSFNTPLNRNVENEYLAQFLGQVVVFVLDKVHLTGEFKDFDDKVLVIESFYGPQVIYRNVVRAFHTLETENKLRAAQKKRKDKAQHPNRIERKPRENANADKPLDSESLASGEAYLQAYREVGA